MPGKQQGVHVHSRFLSSSGSYRILGIRRQILISSILTTVRLICTIKRGNFEGSIFADRLSSPFCGLNFADVHTRAHCTCVHCTIEVTLWFKFGPLKNFLHSCTAYMHNIFYLAVIAIECYSRVLFDHS